ncbi:MAG: tetratricopeptide repeat protein [Desulfohalobiaceae bacterium]
MAKASDTEQQEQQQAAQPSGGEHSRLYLFMQEHYKKLILGVCLIILVAAASSGYQYYQNQRQEQARQELTRITDQLQGQEKYQALQELLPEAPQQMQKTVLLELANSAQNLEDFSSAADYWSKLADNSQDPGLRTTARLGQAKALAEQGQGAASLDILQELLQEAPDTYQESIYFEIAALAEEAQKWELALEAYKHLAGTKELDSRQEGFLEHKISELEQRLEANGA